MRICEVDGGKCIAEACKNGCALIPKITQDAGIEDAPLQADSLVMPQDADYEITSHPFLGIESVCLIVPPMAILL